MKTCPVCKANCFDDMDVCFGCLHDFSRCSTTAQHARTPVLESSLEDDFEPEEAVVPIHSRMGQDIGSEGPVVEAAVHRGAGAPDIRLDVPSGFRLVLRFEPSSEL